MFVCGCEPREDGIRQDEEQVLVSEEAESPLPEVRSSIRQDSTEGQDETQTLEEPPPALSPSRRSGKLHLDYVALRPTEKQFEVQLKKGSGGVGLDIVASKDKGTIIVGRVKEGAVQVWNAEAEAEGEPDEVVRRGDRVVEVDGECRGDAAAIMKAFRDWGKEGSSDILTLKIIRVMEFKVTKIPSKSQSGEDVLAMFEFRNGKDLILTKVNPSSKKLQPDMELRVGDFIMQVNGIYGSPDELIAEIRTSDQLTLRVRRAD